jgi:hypothetical protein
MSFSADDEDRRSKTIQQFCFVEGFSKASYYELKRRGLGPDELRPPGTAIVRITPQAHDEWHKRMRELRESEAAALEEERRRAQTQQAGRIAAQSPKHVSKRRRRKVAR